MPAWFNELLQDGLVIDMPKYSKFLHGVSMLKQPPGSEIPYWLTRNPFGQLVIQGAAAAAAGAGAGPQQMTPTQLRQRPQHTMELPSHARGAPAAAPPSQQRLQHDGAQPFLAPPTLGGASPGLQGQGAAAAQPSHNFDSAFSTGDGMYGGGGRGMQLEPTTGRGAAQSSLCCFTCGQTDELDHGLLAYGGSAADEHQMTERPRWYMAGAEHYNNIRANPSLASNPKNRKLRVEPKTFMVRSLPPLAFALSYPFSVLLCSAAAAQHARQRGVLIRFHPFPAGEREDVPQLDHAGDECMRVWRWACWIWRGQRA